MGAGGLVEKFRFDRLSQASDGYGNTLNNWSEIFTTAAELEDVRGGEEVLADALTGTGVVEITVRSFGLSRSLCPGDRCVNVRTGQAFNIRAIVNPDERDRYIVLTCERGVAE